ncbi:MAG: hypothetical protein P1V21_01005 [Rhizobiaceae bacterium]|nr:hypothetical protein [Rhizobiaceae bacterium]
MLPWLVRPACVVTQFDSGWQNISDVFREFIHDNINDLMRIIGVGNRASLFNWQGVDASLAP